MPSRIRTGQITSFYLFDVAEAVDLNVLSELLQGATRSTLLVPRSAAPAHLQYEQPPLVFNGEAVGMQSVSDFAIRFKIFDYGVVSMALERPFTGEFADLVDASAELMSNQTLPRDAERCCERLLERIVPALTRPHARRLSEEYVVFTVNQTDPLMTADELLRVHGAEIAQVVLGEREPLSPQEHEEVLAHRMSYLSCDLVVPTWSAAFLYDRDAGAESTLEILEFANSQLLEFRYYDQHLDADLRRIYADLQTRRRHRPLVGRRHERAAHELHSVFIDVSELTERTQNALKFVGDVHAARLFGLAAARLGLNAWKESVRDKLQMLDNIYRFTVEQSGMVRGQVLELTIVLILVLELALVFMGILE